MGTLTGNIINKLRPARRGDGDGDGDGDQLGPCAECVKSMSDVFVAQKYREYRRDIGELYTGPIGGVSASRFVIAAFAGSIPGALVMTTMFCLLAAASGRQIN